MKRIWKRCWNKTPAVLAAGEPLLIISRQPHAQESGTPDLLALDADGNIVIVRIETGPHTA